MLFFKAGSKGKIIPLKLDAKGLQVRAYACKSTDGTIYISIINKGLETAADIQVHTGKRISSVEVQRLTAPSIRSTDQVTFAGSTVAEDGTFSVSVSEKLNAGGSSFLVNVPAASALLAIVR
jgi:alpha-L-arabinofuranosidase